MTEYGEYPNVDVAIAQCEQFRDDIQAGRRLHHLNADGFVNLLKSVRSDFAEIEKLLLHHADYHKGHAGRPIYQAWWICQKYTSGVKVVPSV